MQRITFDGNFCEIAQCAGVRYGPDCEDGACSQRKVWERLRALEDRLGDDYLLDDVCSRSDIRQWIYEAVCASCACELNGDRGSNGCFGCIVDKALRRIGGQA